MHKVSDEFRAALKSEAVQHIRGAFYTAGTNEIFRVLRENDFLDNPKISRQCVESSDNFNIGEMYAGSVELTIAADQSSGLSYYGKELRLEFSLEGVDEWIPLGIWDIVEAQTEVGGKLALTGSDHIARLQCRLGSTTVSSRSLQNIIDAVAETANVEFAQTAAEVRGMISPDFADDPYLFGTLGFAETCWAQIRMIAQLIGGFAFANRHGKIEFKRLTKIDYAIHADARKSIKLSDYFYGIESAAYTDSNGCTYTEYGSNPIADVRAAIRISDNGFLPNADGGEWTKGSLGIISTVLCSALEPLQAVSWHSGTVEWYGDPTLDLGDVVQLTGGIAPAGGGYFPICAETWQFRAPQTLIAAGAPEQSGMSSGSSGGGGGASSASITAPSVTVTRENRIIELETYTGDLTVEDKKTAWCSFATLKTVACILSFSAVIQGIESGTVTFKITVDDVTQSFTPEQIVNINERHTVSFTLPLSASAGTHRITVTATGAAEITAVQAFVYGQELTAKVADYTDSADYEYTAADGKATITKYIGTKTQPDIPQRLSGTQTAVIGSGAFEGTDVTAVYIPEGVTEIE